MKPFNYPSKDIWYVEFCLKANFQSVEFSKLAESLFFAGENVTLKLNMAEWPSIVWTSTFLENSADWRLAFSLKLETWSWITKTEYGTQLFTPWENHVSPLFFAILFTPDLAKIIMLQWSWQVSYSFLVPGMPCHEILVITINHFSVGMEYTTV